MSTQSPDTVTHAGSSSPICSNPAPLTLQVRFTSDWGVSTGVGIAGGVDSTIEKDQRGLPVVRASVLTGVIREQAEQVATMLDDSLTGPWHEFAAILFGNRREQSPADTWHPHRLITITDASLPDLVDSETMTHEVVSLSIDDATGTAKKDHLRFFERAAPCSLTATIEFLTVDSRGRRIAWSDKTLNAARFLLATSGLLVQAIGSDRSDGDGACTVLIDSQVSDQPLSLGTVKRWCHDYLAEHPDAPTAGELRSQSFAAPAVSANKDSAHTGARSASPNYTDFVHAVVSIVLDSPVVSYDVPLSNEIRSLDFLRGTTILPWVHGLLRNALPDDPEVADAVVKGRLLVSDALPVVNGIRGLPMPFVLSSPKVERSDDDSPDTKLRLKTFTNRLKAGEPTEVHTPARDGYVFVGPQLAASMREPSTPTSDVVGSEGAPALVGRQSTAHDSATGTAASGLLFLVRALPAGLQMQATMSIEKSLYSYLEQRLGHELISVFKGDGGLPAFMGARRYSGTFGRVTCHVGSFSPLGDADDARQSTLASDEGLILWFTSDVIVRTSALGGAANVDDLLRAFRRHGIPLKQVPPDQGGRFNAGVRHRRVDSWSANDHQPRPTRMAIKAGSVLKVTLDDEHLNDNDRQKILQNLRVLGTIGIGELRAQGFGRFVVCPGLLTLDSFSVRTLEQSDFVSIAHTANARSSHTSVVSEASATPSTHDEEEATR